MGFGCHCRIYLSIWHREKCRYGNLLRKMKLSLAVKSASIELSMKGYPKSQVRGAQHSVRTRPCHRRPPAIKKALYFSSLIDIRLHSIDGQKMAAKRAALDILPAELWTQVLLRLREQTDVSYLAQSTKQLYEIAHDEAVVAKWLVAQHGTQDAFNVLLFKMPRSLLASCRRWDDEPRTTRTKLPRIVDLLSNFGAPLRRADLQLACKQLIVGRENHNGLAPPGGWNALEWNRAPADLANAEDSEYAGFLFQIAQVVFGKAGGNLSATDLVTFCNILGYEVQDRGSLTFNWPPRRRFFSGDARTNWQLSDKDATVLRQLVFDYNLRLETDNAEHFYRGQFFEETRSLDWLAWDLAVSEYSCFQHLTSARHVKVALHRVWAASMTEITNLYDWEFTQQNITALTSNILSKHHEEVLDAIFDSFIAHANPFKEMIRTFRHMGRGSHIQGEYAARDLVRRLIKHHVNKCEILEPMLAEIAVEDKFRDLPSLAHAASLLGRQANKPDLECGSVELALDEVIFHLEAGSTEMVTAAIQFPYKYVMQRFGPGGDLTYTVAPSQPNPFSPVVTKTMDLIFTLLSTLMEPPAHPESPDKLTIVGSNSLLGMVTTSDRFSGVLSPIAAERKCFTGYLKGILTACMKEENPLVLSASQLEVLEKVTRLVELSDNAHKLLKEDYETCTLNDEASHEAIENAALDGLQRLFELEDSGQPKLHVLSSLTLHFLRSVSQTWKEVQEEAEARRKEAALGYSHLAGGFDGWKEEDEGIISDLFAGDV